MSKILDSDCKKCINLYGYNEMSCTFCKDKSYYKDGLIESENYDLDGNDREAFLSI